MKYRLVLFLSLLGIPSVGAASDFLCAGVLEAEAGNPGGRSAGSRRVHRALGRPGRARPRPGQRCLYVPAGGRRAKRGAQVTTAEVRAEANESTSWTDAQMTDVLERAAQRRQVAESILADLQLLQKWQRFGRPVIVRSTCIVRCWTMGFVLPASFETG